MPKDVPLSPGQVEFGSIVARIIFQMRREINLETSLDDWVDYAGLSKYRLISEFRKLTGVPPMTFHNLLKIERAKELLVHKGFSATETCFECGFESLGSFVTKFTNFVGISPGRYQKAMSDLGAMSVYYQILRHELGFGEGGKRSTKIKFSNRGNISNPIVVGCFDRPMPVGRPNSWRFVPPFLKRTSLELMGRHVLAVSLPIFQKTSDMVRFTPPRIGSAVLDGAETTVSVEMRTPTVYDPPITLAIPAILCLVAPEITKLDY